jgi:putative oxidoreductase
MFGMNKIFNYEVTSGWMDAMGVPSVFLPFVIILEVVGGLAIIIGWKTRLIALALAIFSVLSALIFHFPKIWFETSDFSRKRFHCAPQAL